MAIKSTNNFCCKLESIIKTLRCFYRDAYDFGVDFDSLECICLALIELENALINCDGGYYYGTKEDETEEG